MKFYKYKNEFYGDLFSLEEVGLEYHQAKDESQKDFLRRIDHGGNVFIGQYARRIHDTKVVNFFCPKHNCFMEMVVVPGMVTPENITENETEMMTNLMLDMVQRDLDSYNFTSPKEKLNHIIVGYPFLYDDIVADKRFSDLEEYNTSEVGELIKQYSSDPISAAKMCGYSRLLYSRKFEKIWRLNASIVGYSKKYQEVIVSENRRFVGFSRKTKDGKVVIDWIF